MDCCHEAMETEFDWRVAEGDLRRYRQHGPSPTTRVLIAALLAEGIGGQTLLDVGGGVGVIAHALLKAGAVRADLVELSGAYLSAARTEVERQGHGDRLGLHRGDFVAVADTIAVADIVMLDRVICCYPGMHALIGQSAAKAHSIYGLVYPRDTWWVRVGVGIFNRWSWIRSRRFRAFVHRQADVDALVRRGGFVPRVVRTTLLWHVTVYGNRPCLPGSRRASAPAMGPARDTP